MNKFAAIGLAGEARDSKKIIVVSESVRNSKHAAQDFEGLPIEPSRVVRTNGAYAVEYPGGGRIRFVSRQQGVRGDVADLVFIDWDAEPNVTLDQWRDLQEVVAPAGGAVLRA